LLLYHFSIVLKLIEKNVPACEFKSWQHFSYMFVKFIGLECVLIWEFCSNCIRTKFEVGTIKAREEGYVEKGNEGSLISV